jgi:hypothetical protein
MLNNLKRLHGCLYAKCHPHTGEFPAFIGDAEYETNLV